MKVAWDTCFTEHTKEVSVFFGGRRKEAKSQEEFSGGLYGMGTVVPTVF